MTTAESEQTQPSDPTLDADINRLRADEARAEVARLRARVAELEATIPASDATDAPVSAPDTTPAADHAPIDGDVTADDSVDVLIEGGHLDANGHPCACPHGGGHVCNHA